MASRFLADHCVSNSTVQTLREANYEVFRLRRAPVLYMYGRAKVICRCARREAQTFIPHSTVPPLRHPFHHRFLALFRAVQKIEIDQLLAVAPRRKERKRQSVLLEPDLRNLSTVVTSNEAGKHHCHFTLCQ